MDSKEGDCIAQNYVQSNKVMYLMQILNLARNGN